MEPIFDRQLLRQRRNAAARDFAGSRFLHEEVGERLLERLSEIKRNFPTIINWGAMDGHLTPQLEKLPGAERVIQLEPAGAMLKGAAGLRVVADEEWLPLAPASCNLIVSNLTLHWVNDLPGALIQARHALSPDGLFMASLLGGDTLYELRHSLLKAEAEITGRMAARLSPLTEVRDAGGLLQRAGLALPVVDRERITVTYGNPLRLLQDLKAMGARNTLLQRHPLRRDVLLRAIELYQQDYMVEQGRVQATFEVLFMAGWAPHDSQQKPLRPGSAEHSLATALKPGN